MSIVDFLHIESDTITDSPVQIPFVYENVNIPDGCKLDDVIEIKPVTVETWFRMKPFIMQICLDDFNRLIASSKTPDKELMDIIAKYDSILIEILFLGIHNMPGSLPSWHKQALISNCTWQDIYIILNAILFRIGQQSFSKSITVLQNVSPLWELEIIAAHQNHESWSTAQ